MRAPALQTYSLTDTKNNFSAYTAEANRTGRPFIVEKQDKPWVKITPMQQETLADSIIVPAKNEVVVADIDELFAGYEGDFVPTEDGFAAPCGAEAL